MRNDSMILTKVATSSAPLLWVANWFNSDSMDANLAPFVVAHLNNSGDKEGK